ncbi:hypothetical protein BBJ28_00006210 [Nothophytophthora sp. Chile5]|nr:hypothetical protein BBJ28_00006210 [Nothophytophthora sp. Chile5]
MKTEDKPAIRDEHQLGSEAMTGLDKLRVEEKLQELIRSWGLSRFSEGMALQWLLRSLGASPPGNNGEEDGDNDCCHLRKWIVMQLNHRHRAEGCSDWQMGCPEAKDGLGSVGHDAGDWNVLYLFLHNIDFQANRQLCPKTVAIIESIDCHYDHAFFSAMAPHTHIKKHHGPTNKKLRCHLPLVVPRGQCRLRAGEETIHVQEGKCFVFDDSFEHEAWNDDATHSRIVLIIDVWHPDLSAQERKFFGFLRNSQLRMDKKLCQQSSDNFYSIIKEASEAGPSPYAAVWS